MSKGASFDSRRLEAGGDAELAPRTSHLTPRTPDHWRRLALLLACVFYALVSAWVAWTRSAVDYPDYLLGARGLLDGQDVYSWGEKEFKSAAAEIGIECHAWPYPYPPLTAMVVAPLVPLPYGWGLFLWSLANGLAVVATGRVLGALAPDARTRLVVEIGTFVFCPFWVSLYAGQVNPIVTLIAAWCVVAALAGRDRLAGLCLALSLLLKPLTIGIAAYAVWRARWRMLAAALLAAAATLVIAWLWLGPNALRFLGHQASWSLRTLPPAQNLSSAALRWLTANDYGPALLDQPALAAIAGILGASVLAGATLALCRPSGARPWTRAEIGLVIAAIVIANPRTWYHHYTMIAIPLAVLASRPGAQSRSWWAALGAAYASITIFGLGWHQLRAVPFLLDLATLGGVVIWVMCALLCGREERSARREGSGEEWRSC